ncbi:MAG: hypothetical protein JJU12_00935 [Chlamydiales bacterium]|nr:hypothetical protein [Chlamydiales bacterium]
MEEKAARIAVVAFAIICALFVAGLLTCFATTVYGDIRLITGIAIPVALILGGLGFSSFLIDREEMLRGPFRCKFSREDTLTHIDSLKRDSLKKIFSHYRKKRLGGLQPLYRNGILTTDQAQRLHNILEKYPNSTGEPTEDPLENEWEALKGDIKEHLSLTD